MDFTEDVDCSNFCIDKKGAKFVTEKLDEAKSGPLDIKMKPMNSTAKAAIKLINSTEKVNNIFTDDEEPENYFSFASTNYEKLLKSSRRPISSYILDRSDNLESNLSDSENEPSPTKPKFNTPIRIGNQIESSPKSKNQVNCMPTTSKKSIPHIIIKDTSSTNKESVIYFSDEDTFDLHNCNKEGDEKAKNESIEICDSSSNLSEDSVDEIIDDSDDLIEIEEVKIDNDTPDFYSLLADSNDSSLQSPLTIILSSTDDEEELELENTSSDDDDDYRRVVRAGITTNLKLGNITGMNSGLSKISFDAKTKNYFNLNESNEESNTSSNSLSKKPLSSKILNRYGNSNHFVRLPLDPGESSSDWAVDVKDIIKDTNYNKYTLHKKFCSICRKVGNHTYKLCNDKRNQFDICIYCSETGHEYFKCRYKICPKCSGPHHTATGCTQNLNKILCSECKMRGHHSQICSVHWRKYSTIITPGADSGLPIGRNKYKSCYNCGASTHFGFECKESRMNNTPAPPSPLIHITKKQSEVIKNDLEIWRPSGYGVSRARIWNPGDIFMSLLRECVQDNESKKNIDEEEDNQKINESMNEEIESQWIIKEDEVLLSIEEEKYPKAKQFKSVKRETKGSKRKKKKKLESQLGSKAIKSAKDEGAVDSEFKKVKKNGKKQKVKKIKARIKKQKKKRRDKIAKLKEQLKESKREKKEKKKHLKSQVNTILTF